MIFYTKKGDKGKSYIKNNFVSKDHVVLEALGELDELNSLIGVVKNYVKEYKKKLQEVQENLFIVQAQLAWLLYSKFEKPKLSKEKIEKLEKEIDEIEKKIKPERKFIIPGKEVKSAWLHYLRAVCRRAERKLVSLSKKYKIEKETLAYINRLSSYFYALARLIVYKKGLKEDHPKYK
jgi:cob(I)alamin adenosyltransferase